MAAGCGPRNTGLSAGSGRPSPTWPTRSTCSSIGGPDQGAAVVPAPGAGGRGADHRDTRRRAALDDLARDEADRTATVALVKRLADARLVVTSVNPLDGRAEVELAHETLITAWGRLQGWIEQDRAGLVVRQRLAEDARMWERSGRKGDYLYRRAQLEPASSGTPRIRTT